MYKLIDVASLLSDPVIWGHSFVHCSNAFAFCPRLFRTLAQIKHIIHRRWRNQQLCEQIGLLLYPEIVTPPSSSPPLLNPPFPSPLFCSGILSFKYQRPQAEEENGAKQTELIRWTYATQTLRPFSTPPLFSLSNLKQYILSLCLHLLTICGQREHN